MNLLSTTRAAVRELPLEPRVRGQWLAWVVSVDRGDVPSSRVPVELQEWRRRLGLERSATVGDAATDPSPQAAARAGRRTAEEWLREWSLWMSGSQEAEFHRRVVMQLEVASQVPSAQRSRELTLAALQAWSEMAHTVIANVRSPLTLAQRQTMEQATHVFNGAVPVLQAGLDLARSSVPWLAVAFGLAAVGAVLVVTSTMTPSRGLKGTA